MAVLLSAAVPEAMSSRIVSLSSIRYLSLSRARRSVLPLPTVTVSPLSRFIPMYASMSPVPSLVTTELPVISKTLRTL